MSSSAEYWRQREEEALKRYIKDEKEYDKQIERIYQNQLDAIQKEIDAFYGKYAVKENITIAEAKKRVSKLDIAAYERKAEKYVAEKNFSKRANEEMRLYNLTMKVNRLEMLKANIGLELIKGHDKLDRFMVGILKDRTEAELKRQAGILGKTIKNNEQLANAIPNASFHNATFSDRIWANQAILRNNIGNLLQSGLIQGKNPRVLMRELRTLLVDPKKGATYNTERLMRTELARVQTEAQKQSFERNGFEYYEFIANSGCCGICQDLNGQHFKVKDMIPGENAAPLHPNCRCSCAAWEASDKYEAWLDYLDKGGGTAEWDAYGETTWRNAKKVLAKTQGTDILEINDTDRKAIYDYISAKAYIVNDKLRRGIAFSREEQAFIDNLDVTLEKIPSYKGYITRSIFFYSTEEVSEFVKQYKIGGTITYSQYFSTTKGEIYNPAGQVQIIIRDSKRGKDISFLNESEQEILYQRGATFNILDAKLIKETYCIYLEEA